MANLSESITYDAGVYQIETTDPVLGGPTGVTNTPLKNLANRTAYLKKHVDDLEAGNTAAGKATILATARTIGLSGDVTGSGSFNGSANLTIAGTVVSASETVAGKVELATIAEALAAADTSRAVTPAGLANYWSNSKMGVVGQVAFFAMNAVPAGWLRCNGAAISRITYADLYAVLGTLHGAGDGSNTFNLPDLRGEFLRGYDDSRGVDTGRVFGSAQKGTLVGGYDDNRSDGHSGIVEGGASTYNSDPVTSAIATAYGLTRVLYGTPSALSIYPMSEAPNWYAITRPRNLALLPCIKY